MFSVNRIKIFLIAIWILGIALLFSFNSAKSSASSLLSYFANNKEQQKSNDYVGSETCKACHEEQFNSYADTKHAKLETLASWKDRSVGCESCHGSGKAHVEAGGDKTKIASFKNMTSKAISDSCLTCHAGKESHNNYRRGEHWRNNVGCTDCHAAHGANHGKFKDGSMTLTNSASTLKPTPAMLKDNEQQLCISCHRDVKSHFNKPFRHKVMEDAMKCSDCHNAHGGFESKQTNLAIGADSACLKCHTDKQGPFVFEHAPLKVEGCSSCHTPHGSANPKLLKRPQVRQLCIECHSGITQQLSDGPSGGPHGQTSLRSRNCTNCHTAIHGSNADVYFFR